MDIIALRQKLKSVTGHEPRGSSARCPAHDDRAASLSIGTGDDGRVLLHCHAGCATEDICKTLGITMADIMPAKINGHTPRPTGTGGRKIHPTMQAAIDAALWGIQQNEPGARIAAVWPYTDAAGVIMAAVARIDLPTLGGQRQRKEFRPVHHESDGWCCGDPPSKWPLYRMEHIAKADVVHVVEGEKCADALATLEYPTTTSAHGAQSAGKTRWNTLAGKTVYLWPDSDAAGESYIADVAAILTEINCKLQVVRLVGVLEHGDIADWLDYRDTIDPDELRAQIDALIEAAPLYEPPAADAKPTAPAPIEAMMVCAADVPHRDIAWLWRHRIPRGMPSLLASRPGLGKTLIGCAITASVTTGCDFPDGEKCEPGSVIFLDAENPLDTVLGPRLQAAGCDRRKVHVITGQVATDADGKRREKGITLGDIGVIERAIQRVGDCRLLIVDPVGSFLGEKVDAHRDNETRAVLAPLADLAARHDIAVLLIAHHRKQASGFADDLVLGSRAFTGLCRISWHVSADENDKTLMLLTLGKTNIGPRVDGWSFRIDGDPPVVQWVGPIQRDADDVIGDRPSHRGPEPLARENCAEWLRRMLADGGKGVKVIREEAEGAGYAWRTVERAKETLRIVPERSGYGIGGGWSWNLPTEVKREAAPKTAT